MLNSQVSIKEVNGSQKQSQQESEYLPEKQFKMIAHVALYLLDLQEATFLFVSLPYLLKM